MRQLMTRMIVWAFERFYHEGAWSYDSVAWVISRGYWRSWAGVIADELRTLPLLELGCGTGFLQQARWHSAALTVGLDESAPMLRLARRRLRRRAPGGLVRGIGQRLPFAAGSWPVVVATFPAPYLFQLDTLVDVRRVLAPGGRLIIVDGGMVPAGAYAGLIALVYRVLLGVGSATTAPVRDPRRERLAAAGYRTAVSWRSVGRSQVEVLEAWPQ